MRQLEMKIEGPEMSTHDIEMTDAAASEQDEATDGPIDVDEKMDTESWSIIAGKRLKPEDSVEFYNRIGDRVKLQKLYEELHKVMVFITD